MDFWDDPSWYDSEYGGYDNVAFDGDYIDNSYLQPYDFSNWSSGYDDWASNDSPIWSSFSDYSPIWSALSDYGPSGAFDYSFSLPNLSNLFSSDGASLGQGLTLRDAAMALSPHAWSPEDFSRETTLAGTFAPEQAYSLRQLGEEAEQLQAEDEALLREGASLANFGMRPLMGEGVQYSPGIFQSTGIFQSPELPGGVSYARYSESPGLPEGVSYARYLDGSIAGLQSEEGQGLIRYGSDTRLSPGQEGYLQEALMPGTRDHLNNLDMLAMTPEGREVLRASGVSPEVLDRYVAWSTSGDGLDVPGTDYLRRAIAERSASPLARIASNAGGSAVAKLIEKQAESALKQQAAREKLSNSKVGQGLAAAQLAAQLARIFSKDKGMSVKARDSLQQDLTPEFQAGRPMRTLYAKGGKIEIPKRVPGGLLPIAAKLAESLIPGGQDDAVDIKVAPGEYVIDAEIVAALGDGSTEAGAAKLDRMRENIREHKRGGSVKKIPPKAKTIEQYLKG